MAKTLISRLDAENIVRAAVDPETHEATGDVYDIVNDVSYPFGGGSGSSNIPTLTVTYKFTEGIVNPQITFNDSGMLNPYSVALNPEAPYGIGSEFTLNMDPEGTPVKFLYQLLDGTWGCVPPMGLYDYDSSEDAVNIVDGDIIDPSKDASVTFILTSK